jgi:cell division protein FtsB
MAILDGQLSSRRFQLTVRWTLVFALWALLMSMASGQAGISNYVELINKRNVLVDVNMRLKIENQQLEERIHLLKTSATEQIRFLKDEFGYVQPGEYVYRFETKRQNDHKKKPIKPQTSEVNLRNNPNG